MQATNLFYVGVYFLFLLFLFFGTIYAWLYTRRAMQSSAIIGVSAPQISFLFLRVATILGIFVMVLSAAFLIEEMLFLWFG